MEGAHEDIPHERLRKQRQSVLVSSLIGNPNEMTAMNMNMVDLTEGDEDEVSEVEDEDDVETESTVGSKEPSEAGSETIEGPQMDKKARRASTQPLEDQLTNEKLKQLEEVRLTICHNSLPFLREK